MSSTDEISKPERSGWRDQALSERHRKWGYYAPAVDVDFLLCEYESKRPMGLVEYKSEHAKPIRISECHSLQAIAELGNRGKIPAFVFKYASDFSWWNVIPLNEFALDYLPNRERMDGVSESRVVELLYRIRGRLVPEEVQAFLRQQQKS